MTTKKQSTTTNQYDPGSMSRYQGWQNSMFGPLSSLFNNPFSSPFFNLNLQQQSRAATQVGGRNASNALLNFQRSGIGGQSFGGGARQSLLAGIGRANTGLQYQGFMNSVNQAQMDRWNAASLGSNLFQPLQTGQTNVQKTSGLGTWLPQVIGAGLGIATGGLTGALGAAGGLLGGLGASGGGPGNLISQSNLGNLVGGYGAGSYFNPFTGPIGSMPQPSGGAPWTSFMPSNPFMTAGGNY